MRRTAWLLSAAVFWAASAPASEDAVRPPPPVLAAPATPPRFWKLEDFAAATPREVFDRTQAVLDHFGVPRAPDSAGWIDPIQGMQTSAGYAEVARIMDPKGFFSKFTAGGLAVFQDADSRQVPDFSYRFGEAGSPAHERLVRAARTNPVDRPLLGLRVAIDPGHMGGDAWDRHTGKFVHDGRGHKLSEGTMALQVALLLERDLRALGADILLTRRTLAPATDVAYEGMDLRPYALRELEETTQAAWFQSQVRAASGSALFAAVAAHPAFRALFDPGFYNHDTYFILREDLAARSAKIEAFDADISLVIHFDTSSPPGDSQGIGTYPNDFTKAYVLGSYSPVELSSREARRLFAQHALDASAWRDSLELGRAVVGRLHRDLGLPFDRGGGGTSAQVEPGIFSRNLGVSRRVAQRALTYLECLYYNDPREFAALRDFKYEMEIGGVMTRYAPRLVEVERALLNGVRDFANSRGSGVRR